MGRPGGLHVGRVERRGEVWVNRCVARLVLGKGEAPSAILPSVGLRLSCRPVTLAARLDPLAFRTFHRVTGANEPYSWDRRRGGVPTINAVQSLNLWFLLALSLADWVRTSMHLH